jgi:hypothetical protein
MIGGAATALVGAGAAFGLPLDPAQQTSLIALSGLVGSTLVISGATVSARTAAERIKQGKPEFQPPEKKEAAMTDAQPLLELPGSKQDAPPMPGPGPPELKPPIPGPLTGYAPERPPDMDEPADEQELASAVAALLTDRIRRLEKQLSDAKTGLEQILNGLNYEGDEP